MSLTESEKRQAEMKLLEYGSTDRNRYSLIHNGLIGPEEFLIMKDDMNLFLFGIIADQAVKSELAWAFPFRLTERIGDLDPKRISNLDQEYLERSISEKPALHRYPSKTASYIRSACGLLSSEYGSSAENIWRDGSSGDIVRRLSGFPGISVKKALLACLLLYNDFGTELKDKEETDVACDGYVCRVCFRSGISDTCGCSDVIRSCRSIHGEFPLMLSTPLWLIGRNICTESDPGCQICPLSEICRKNFS